MKRLTWVVVFVLFAGSASPASAIWRDIQRYFGTHYGPGYHAYDGCYYAPAYQTVHEFESVRPEPAVNSQGSATVPTRMYPVQRYQSIVVPR